MLILIHCVPIAQVCSLVGSLSVMCVKAVGLAIVETARPNGPNDFRSGLTYIFLAALLVCVAVQMIYLNKALDVFNTSVVRATAVKTV